MESELLSAANIQAISAFAIFVEKNLSDGYTVLGDRCPYLSRTAQRRYWTRGKIIAAQRPLLLADWETIRSKFLGLFSLLVFCHRVEYLKEYFLRHALNDDSFPLLERPAQWPPGYMSEELFQTIQKYQNLFFPLIFNRDSLYDNPIADDRALPITSMELLRPGDVGMGSLYRIELDSTYNELAQKPDGRQTDVFVLKAQTSSSSHKNEVTALTHFRNHYSDHIVGFYGSFIQSGMHCLILEFVDGGNLGDYLTHTPPPQKPEDRLKFWQSYSGFLKGIHGVHSIDDERFSGIHGDIKPDNLLLQNGPSNSPYDFVPKIADFGYSHVRSLEAGRQDKGGLDRHGNQQYCAPEASHHLRFLTTGTNRIDCSADIFSIGAVTDEVLVWMAFGSNEIDSYFATRKQATDQIDCFKGSGYGGCFHNGVFPLSEVRRMHDRVREALPDFDHITRKMIDLVEREMLVGRSQGRSSAKDLIKLFELYYQNAKERMLPQRTVSPLRPSSAANAHNYWAEALETLNEADRQLISQSMIWQDNGFGRLADAQAWAERLVEICAERKDKERDSRWLFRLAGRDFSLRAMLENIMKLLQRIKETTDVGMAENPDQISLPWAALSLLFTVMTANSQQAGALYAGAERVLEVMARGGAYELYLQELVRNGRKNVEDFKASLVLLYARLLTFLVSGLRAFQRNRLESGLHALWRPQDIIDFEKTYKDLEVELKEESDRFVRSFSTDLKDHVVKLLTSIQLTSTTIFKKPDKKGTKSSLAIKPRVENSELNLECERSEILQWTSGIPVDDHHAHARGNRTAGTGQWILKIVAFRFWLESLDPLLLWIHGIPGAGKTTLVSAILDSFVDIPSDDRTAWIPRGPEQWPDEISEDNTDLPRDTFCFFYCLRTQNHRRQPENILRSFMKQLAASNDEAYAVLASRYTAKRRSGFLSEAMTIDECEQVLKDMLSIVPMAVFVLDGLDECFVESRGRLIDVLTNLVESGLPLKVLISSRRDGDIKEQLQDRANISISATDNEEDIMKFVRDRIAAYRARRKVAVDTIIPRSLEDQIVRTIQEKSNGMFQWAALHIGHILTLRRRSDIMDALSNLPKDLDKTYDEIFSRIEQLDGSLRHVATRAIEWIIARDGVASVEILAAVCQDPDNDQICEVDIDTETLLAACHNLVVMELGSEKTVPALFRFAHLSIQEYCEEKRRTPHLAHSFAAKACLLSLLYWNTTQDGELSLGHPSPTWSRPPRSEPTLLKYSSTGTLTEYSFAPTEYSSALTEYSSALTEHSSTPIEYSSILVEYSSEWWVSHVQKAVDHPHRTRDDRLDVLLRHFLGYPGKTSEAFEAWASRALVRHGDVQLWSALEKKRYVMSVDLPGATWSGELSFGASPLVAICFLGLQDAFAPLEDPRPGFLPTTLDAKILTLLSPLSSFPLLLSLLRGINFPDRNSLEDLLWKYMVSSPQDLCPIEVFTGEVSVWAADYNRFDIWKTKMVLVARVIHELGLESARKLCGAAIAALISRISDRPRLDSSRSSSIQQGLTQVFDLGAELEFDKQLSVFMRQSSITLHHAFPLAIAKSQPDIVRWLLDRGAHASATSLVYACFKCGYDLSKAGNCRYPSPEADARLEICQMLLDHGADINARVSAPALFHYGPRGFMSFPFPRSHHLPRPTIAGGTALIAASVYGCVELAHMLIERGATVDAIYDVNGECERGVYDYPLEPFFYPTPLIAACWEGHIDTCRLLLENRAEVHLKVPFNLRGDQYISPYLAASESPDRKTIVALLREYDCGVQRS